MRGEAGLPRRVVSRARPMLFGRRALRDRPLSCRPPRLARSVLGSASAACSEREVGWPPRLARSVIGPCLCLRLVQRARGQVCGLRVLRARRSFCSEVPRVVLTGPLPRAHNLIGEADRSSARQGRARVRRAVSCGSWLDTFILN